MSLLPNLSRLACRACTTGAPLTDASFPDASICEICLEQLSADSPDNPWNKNNGTFTGDTGFRVAACVNSHIFHKGCLKAQMDTGAIGWDKCPLCREDIHAGVKDALGHAAGGGSRPAGGASLFGGNQGFGGGGPFGPPSPQSPQPGGGFGGAGSAPPNPIPNPFGGPPAPPPARLFGQRDTPDPNRPLNWFADPNVPPEQPPQPAAAARDRSYYYGEGRGAPPPGWQQPPPAPERRQTRSMTRNEGGQDNQNQGNPPANGLFGSVPSLAPQPGGNPANSPFGPQEPNESSMGYITDPGTFGDAGPLWQGPNPNATGLFATPFTLVQPDPGIQSATYQNMTAVLQSTTPDMARFQEAYEARVREIMAVLEAMRFSNLNSEVLKTLMSQMYKYINNPLVVSQEDQRYRRVIIDSYQQLGSMAESGGLTFRFNEQLSQGYWEINANAVQAQAPPPPAFGGLYG